MVNKKPTIVALDKEQIQWLESKIEEGYSKSGLIRYAVKRLMTEPNISKEVKEDKPEKTEAKELHLVNLLDTAFDEDVNNIALDETMEKKFSEPFKTIDWGLKNVERLEPKTAYILGMIKGSMMQYIQDSGKYQTKSNVDEIVV